MDNAIIFPGQGAQEVGMGKSLFENSWDNPIGDQNDNYLSSYVCRWSNNSLWDLWLGWGNKGAFCGRNT